MFYDFLAKFIDNAFFYPFFITILTLLLIMKLHFHVSSLSKKSVKIKNNIQTIHVGEISRLGGLAILIGFFTFANFHLDEEVKKTANFLIITSLPIVFFGLIEDLYQNVRHSLRLFSIFLSSIIFTSFFPFEWPYINSSIINGLISSSVGSILFYSFAISSITNAINIIDGMNGLATLTMLVSLFALAFLSYITGDFFIFSMSVGTIIILFAFLLLNFPFGKIFMGDMGAYFSGFVLSTLIIIFYGRHHELNYWGALMLLIYPAIEILFSIARKLYLGRSPFYPDGDHLHLIIFFMFKKIFKSAIKANISTTLFLSFIWMLPLILLRLDYKNEQHIIFSICYSISLYVFMYITVKYFHNKISK